MNIGYINPTFLIRRPLAELCKELSTEHEITVLLPKKRGEKFKNTWHNDDALKKVTVITYNAISISKNFELPLPVDITFFSKLAKLFRRNDVVHTWAYFYIQTWWTLVYRLFSRKTKLIISCDTFPGYSFSSGKFIDICFRIYTALCGWILFRVPDRIHLYGNSMKKYARQAGVPKKKIKVISTGIHTNKFDKAKAYKKTSLEISQQSFIYIYGGLLIARKGIDILLKAMKQVVDKYPQSALFLVGEGPQTKEYKELTKQLQLDNNVQFLGWRKDMPELIKTSDALVLASRGEGLPGIVMEGMAAKKPIIATNIPCIPDLVKEKETGFLSQKENVAAFAEKMMQVQEISPSKRKAMGVAGYKYIERLSWNKLSTKYLEMYRGK